MPENRVLVIDDDAYLRIMLSLELHEAVILEASRLEEGYDLAMTESPDVVIIDRRLPDGDGIDLVRRLRANQAMRQVPIMLVTAGHDEAHRWSILRAGADEYLPKPVDADDLNARIRRILSLPAEQRRERRLDLANRLMEGEQGDLDPVPPPPEPHDEKGHGLFRRKR